MSSVKSLASSLNLVVVDAKVATINPIIFQAKVRVEAFGDVVMNDKVPTLIDVKANTATPLTTDSVKDATISGLKAEKPTAFQATAIKTSEDCGTISEITFAKGTKGVSCPQDVIAFCKANDMKVVDVTVDTQHDVIFSTLGIKSLKDLTDHDGTMYKLDVASNTATIVNAEALSAQAVADFKAGKESTDATRFAQQFGLISSLTLSK